jgi:molybdopterin-containing oxidoreductase family iron-sulfur binding subunit
MSADDRPVTFDDEWERRSEQILDETEFDTDLGIELARDAQRLVDGELTEGNFYEKYHEEILQEFGEDDREFDEAMADLAAKTEDPDGIREALESLAGDAVTRRDMMKTSGVAAMGFSMAAGDKTDPEREASGAPAATQDPAATGNTPTEGEGTRWGMVINLNNCDGCLACMAACSAEHGLSGGANWMYVMAYEDQNQGGEENFMVRPCQHCTDSPCTKVCPVGARHTRSKDGLVLTDYDICIGCRYCMVSCPYGVNYFQWGEPDVADSEIPDEHQIDNRGKWVGARPPEGVMGKCTFCVDRQDGQMGEDKIGTTACEEACAMEAIHFGDLNDPESPPNQHLTQYRDQQENDLSKFPDRKGHTVSTFQLLEERGTNPNVHYIGNEPSQEAKQVEGPVTYEDVGLVDNRKQQVLDKGASATMEEQA